MNALLIVVAVVVIGVPLAALAVAVWVGGLRSGYDVPACWAAYETSRAAGEDLAVMEPESEPVS